MGRHTDMTDRYYQFNTLLLLLFARLIELVIRCMINIELLLLHVNNNEFFIVGINVIFHYFVIETANKAGHEITIFPNEI